MIDERDINILFELISI